jgi:hypothetical protein
MEIPPVRFIKFLPDCDSKTIENQVSSFISTAERYSGKKLESRFHLPNRQYPFDSSQVDLEDYFQKYSQTYDKEIRKNQNVYIYFYLDIDDPLSWTEMEINPNLSTLQLKFKANFLQEHFSLQYNLFTKDNTETLIKEGLFDVMDDLWGGYYFGRKLELYIYLKDCFNKKVHKAFSKILHDTKHQSLAHFLLENLKAIFDTNETINLSNDTKPMKDFIKTCDKQLLSSLEKHQLDELLSSLKLSTKKWLGIRI